MVRLLLALLSALVAADIAVAVAVVALAHDHTICRQSIMLMLMRMIVSRPGIYAGNRSQALQSTVAQDCEGTACLPGPREDDGV